MSKQLFVLEVNPHIPEKLSRLRELATNLWYSWHRPTRALFVSLNPQLWSRVGHNPKLFLRYIDEEHLKNAAQDPVFLAQYEQALAAYDTYLNEPARGYSGPPFQTDDLIAYFCAEYGFHESFPIYSGGLGILAGDHCKTASDLRLPFVAVGLLYRQGYFAQAIDADGNQITRYKDSEHDEVPVFSTCDPQGSEVRVTVGFPGRQVIAKVWEAHIGHVKLYLLDTNLEENSPHDREITYKLYGGDTSMRIRQEIILGVGGVRALRQLGLKPSVWHMNEGHAAFLVLERIRELVKAGLAFEAALEAVAANSIFTTHTPVPAGHDVFGEDLVMEYFQDFPAQFGISVDEFMQLGHLADSGSFFNMTTLAVKGSRHQNGVSRIHGGVSSKNLADFWPQVSTVENPVSYVTNGVHVPTFLSQDWLDLFNRFLGAYWPNRLSDETFWKRIHAIPDHLFWNVSQSIKSQMLYFLRERLLDQHLRNQVSEVHLERMLKYVDPSNPNVLTIGFGRRFATYKRATLLFTDLNVLREILGDSERPVLFIFAGKAHPADHPGQELMRTLHRTASLPEFVGKILLVENYDLSLARPLVAGVDVWLNNPVYPLEASGTSGIKAAINGTLNLSVVDGWWAEGYNGENGWAIKPSPQRDEGRRDYEDARSLYETLQDHVIPLYYQRGEHGYAPGWVKMCKRSMASVIPRFNMGRVLHDYVGGFYQPAARQGRRLTEDDYSDARRLAAWKTKIKTAWPGVTIRCLHVTGASRIKLGERLSLDVAARLNGLDPEDVTVELLVTRRGAVDRQFWAGGFTSLGATIEMLAENNREQTITQAFAPVGMINEGREYRYTLEFAPQHCGQLTYQIRAFPCHPLLTHPHEMGLMIWC